jgi:hypothetical protein
MGDSTRTSSNLAPTCCNSCSNVGLGLTACILHVQTCPGVAQLIVVIMYHLVPVKHACMHASDDKSVQPVAFVPPVGNPGRWVSGLLRHSMTLPR